MNREVPVQVNTNQLCRSGSASCRYPDPHHVVIRIRIMSLSGSASCRYPDPHHVGIRIRIMSVSGSASCRYPDPHHVGIRIRIMSVSGSASCRYPDLFPLLSISALHISNFMVPTWMFSFSAPTYFWKYILHVAITWKCSIWKLSSKISRKRNFLFWLKLFNHKLTLQNELSKPKFRITIIKCVHFVNKTKLI